MDAQIDYLLIMTPRTELLGEKPLPSFPSAVPILPFFSHSGTAHRMLVISESALLPAWPVTCSDSPVPEIAAFPNHLCPSTQYEQLAHGGGRADFLWMAHTAGISAVSAHLRSNPVPSHMAPVVTGSPDPRGCAVTLSRSRS